MFLFLRHHRIRRHASQIWKFVICGGIGFLLDLSSLSLFVEILGIDARIAVVLSSFVGAAFVFVANKFFTFKNRETAYGYQIFKFLLVYGVAIAGNALISNLLIYAGIHYLFAKIMAIGLGAVWNYALSHGFIFRRGEDVDAVVT